MFNMRKMHLFEVNLTIRVYFCQNLFFREIMIPVVIILLNVVLCRTTENPLAHYLGNIMENPICPWVKINNFIIFEFIWLFSVPDLRNDCIENCENEMIECFFGCNNDSACLRECLRGETDCIKCKLQFNPYCKIEFRGKEST